MHGNCPTWKIYIPKNILSRSPVRRWNWPDFAVKKWKSLSCGHHGKKVTEKNEKKVRKLFFCSTFFSTCFVRSLFVIFTNLEFNGTQKFKYFLETWHFFKPVRNFWNNLKFSRYFEIFEPIWNFWANLKFLR